jgi:hypothetical protein
VLRIRPSTKALTLLALLAATSAGLADEGPFPAVRPATRAQAATVLSGGGNLPIPCLTPLIQGSGATGSAAAVVRAVSLLERPALLAGERRHTDPAGATLRFTTARGVFDRLRADDRDRNGLPDPIDVTVAGLADARDLFARLGVATREPAEVLLAHVGARIDGYAVTRGGATRLVLDSSLDDDALRRAAIHQYAHGVALDLGLAAEWGEALATWSVMRLTGGPHDETLALIGARLASLDRGLGVTDLRLAAGNAVWLAFLEEAYGVLAVRLAVEELAAGDSAAASFDRALRRAAGQGLSDALREFQLWTLLVGDRSAGEQFSFAERLGAPRFCGEARGLPALSVLGAEPLAPLGSCAIRLRPDGDDGGLRLQFDGDLATPWSADLLLVGTDGGMQRLGLPLSGDGRGEVTVPLDGLREALLLVRNVGDEESGPQRYGWAAEVERGFPVEIATLTAVRSTGRSRGVVVQWETASEQQLLGFNVLRADESGNGAVKINPVWIPALGGESEPASYQFLDLGAEPDRGYVYRVEAVTRDGLSSLSAPANAPRPTP